jgi:hypothetical protein
MSFYQEMQNIASGLLGEFKQGVIEYIETVPGDGPADNPGEPTFVATPIDAVMRGVNIAFVDNTTIKVTDLQTVFSVRSIANPTIDGFIMADGIKYKIIQLQAIPPAGIPVAWRAIVRK